MYQCIVCEYIEDSYINKFTTDKFICSKKEPISRCDIEEENKIKIVSDFIDEYKLSKNEIIKINIWLMKKLLSN